MALKDWKRTKSKTYNPLFIKKHTYGNGEKAIGIGDTSPYLPRWEVDYFNIPSKNYDKFETKNRAIASAFDFMKTH